MRALRKLRTYHRQQAVLEDVLERDDEIRAIETLLKTLLKLRDARARERVLAYVSQRVWSEIPPGLLEPPPTTASPAEAQAVARQRIDGITASGGAAQ